MKSIVVFLLIFSIFGDFTSEAFGNSHFEDFCTTFTCEQTDLHTDNSEGRTEHNDGDQHCHCHAGHLHLVVFYQLNSVTNSLLSKQYIQLYFTVNRKISDYTSDIIKPPIA